MGKARGWKNPEKGPRCPGCGYPVLGLKDMRCPECGRVLDVRDFDFPDSDHAAYRKRLKRSGAIGGVIAIGLVLVVLLVVFVINAAFLSGGVIVPWFVVLLVVCVIWLGRVVWSVGRDVKGDLKRKR